MSKAYVKDCFQLFYDANMRSAKQMAVAKTFYPTMHDQARRFKILEMTEQLFCSMMNAIFKRQGSKNCYEYLEGIPKGSTVTRLSFDPVRCCVIVLISHPSFPNVPEGEVIGRLKVTIRTKVYQK